MAARASAIMANQEDLADIVSMPSSDVVTKLNVAASDGFVDVDLLRKTPLGSGNKIGWSRLKAYRTETSSETSQMMLAQFGAHQRISDKSVVGVMLQLDRFELTDNVADDHARGAGFLVGPYLVGSPSDLWSYETRLLWGRSENRASVGGGASENFATERWLASIKAEGDVPMRNGWRWQPGLRMSYFQDSHDSFLDTFGGTVSAQTVSLGEARFNMDFELKFEVNTGGTWTAKFGYSLATHFGANGAPDDLEALAIGNARHRLGVSATGSTQNGWVIAGAISSEGIAENGFSGLGASLTASKEF